MKLSLLEVVLNQCEAAYYFVVVMWCNCECDMTH